jgi:DNA mismatch endonuclease, patch repair protein
MTDVLTPEQRHACMASVRSRDTTPEMVVRRLVHRLGYRYALHKKTLPGRPDLALVSRRCAIFVHGCFWHGHDCLRGGRVPATNRAYWTTKVERNRNRDVASLEALQSLGWRTLTIWECELKDAARLATRLQRFVASS